MKKKCSDWYEQWNNEQWKGLQNVTHININASYISAKRQIRAYYLGSFQKDPGVATYCKQSWKKFTFK